MKESKDINVNLKHSNCLSIIAQAGRTAWKSFHKGGLYDECTDEISDIDKEFLDRIINKHKHGSVAEHLVYNFEIQGVSRALLQELVRHRISSFTVVSTRYTLKELKEEDDFNDFRNEIDFNRAKKYVRFTGNDSVDETIFYALFELQKLVKTNISNDIVKYCLPEAYKTTVFWTVNARSLQNFLELRLDKSALWEIRELANELYNALPEDHKFLFEKIYEKKVKD
jgi:thymidylate synthase (FAD)